MGGMVLSGRATVRISSDVNIVIAGDSIANSQGSQSPFKWSEVLATIAPFNQPIINNISINGTRVIDWITDNAAITAAYRSDKRRNVLFFWCGTNDIYVYGTSAASTYSSLQSLLGTLQAAHPDWIIVLATTIPRQTDAAKNAELLVYNGLLVNGMSVLRTLCVRKVIDMRLMPDFAFTNYVAGSYTAKYVDQIHPNDSGNADIPVFLAPLLSYIPIR